MSLASLKRSIKVGTVLKMVRHDWFPEGNMVVHGNLGSSQIKGKLLGVERPVVLVQSSQIALQLGESKSFLTWPKANCIRETPKGFEIDLDGTGKFEHIMGYEIASTTPAEAATNEVR